MADFRPLMINRRLPLLLLLALSLRVAAVALLYTSHAAPVTYEHGAIAENLLAGKGFSVTFLGVEGLTSQQAPLYPLLLASLYALFGAGSPAAVVAMQLLQCLAGAALVACVFWLARSLSPARPEIAWLAALGAAVYPPHIYAVTHVQVAIWTALALTLLMAVVASPSWKNRWLQSAVAGLIAGVLLLIDPIMAVCLPVVALWMTVTTSRHSHTRSLSLPRSQAPLGNARMGSSASRGTKRSFGWGVPKRSLGTSFGRLPQISHIAPAILMAAVALAVIAPWLIRNYRVHGELVFIKSTFGYALWQGNNPASWGTDKIPKSSAELIRHQHNGGWRDQDRALWEARHETLYVDDVLLKPAGYAEFAGLSEPARSRILGQRAWTFISDNPSEYARLCLQRLRFFLLFDETNPKAAHRLYRASTLVWLGLALVGPLTLAREWKAWWPLYAAFLAVMMFHALTIVSARFRIPVEPISFCWSAGAAAGLVARLRQAFTLLLSPAHARGGCTLQSVNTELDSPAR